MKTGLFAIAFGALVASSASAMERVSCDLSSSFFGEPPVSLHKNYYPRENGTEYRELLGGLVFQIVASADNSMLYLKIDLQEPSSSSRPIGEINENGTASLEVRNLVTRGRAQISCTKIP